MDSKRQPWANFTETGPGCRFADGHRFLTLDFLRGPYLLSTTPRARLFYDFRAGIWYAFSVLP